MSTLGRFVDLAYATGVVWGGQLTAMQLDDEEPRFIAAEAERKKMP